MEIKILPKSWTPHAHTHAALFWTDRILYWSHLEIHFHFNSTLRQRDPRIWNNILISLLKIKHFHSNLVGGVNPRQLIENCPGSMQCILCTCRTTTSKKNSENYFFQQILTNRFLPLLSGFDNDDKIVRELKNHLYTTTNKTIKLQLFINGWVSRWCETTKGHRKRSWQYAVYLMYMQNKKI